MDQQQNQLKFGDVLVVVPVRLQSGRYPNKAIAKIRGRSLVDWTVRRCVELRELLKPVRTVEIAVAASFADHGAIGDNSMIDRPGGDTIKDIRLQRVEHARNGTHRAAQTLQQLDMRARPFSRVIVWQVDEPTVCPQAVANLIQQSECNGWQVSTLFEGEAPECCDLNTVGIVWGADTAEIEVFSRKGETDAKHVGIYCVEPSALRCYGAWMTLADAGFGNDSIASAERHQLEQLAWNEGFAIYAEEAKSGSISINTPHDVEAFEEWIDENAREGGSE